MASCERLGWLASFLEAQRVPPGSRLSAWLHGESVMRHGESKAAADVSTTSEKASAPGSTASSRLGGYSPAVNDTIQHPPLQSPINFSRPLTSDGASNAQGSYVHPAFASPIFLEKPPKKRTECQRQQTEPKYSLTAPRLKNPHSREARLRCKRIGTFVSGTLLTIILTVYLGLATANAVPTTAFHVTFIFCIIVVTMVFAHFLIRLCMLTLHGQTGYARKEPVFRGRRRRHHRPRDVEAGEHSRACGAGLADTEIRPQSMDSAYTDKNLLAPPPAYGWWRGSVRVDPEEVQYYDPDRSDLHKHTRNLIFAGSGHGPPSYTSDPIVVELDRPDHLLNTQRVYMRDNAVRDV